MIIKILFSLLIAATKSFHDSGYTKIYFITFMALGCFYVTNDWLLTLYFLLPLIYYSADTGNYHKAKPNNQFTDYEAIPVLDDAVNWLTKLLNEKDAIKFPYTRTFGTIYCVVCSFVFTLPFIATNYWYSLPLFFWVFSVREAHRFIKDGKDWWFSTGLLFGSYSLLYFVSNV